MLICGAKSHLKMTNISFAASFLVNFIYKCLCLVYGPVNLQSFIHNFKKSVHGIFTLTIAVDVS